MTPSYLALVISYLTVLGRVRLAETSWRGRFSPPGAVGLS
jgi:hypothetical protein